MAHKFEQEDQDILHSEGLDRYWLFFKASNKIRNLYNLILNKLANTNPNHESGSNQTQTKVKGPYSLYRVFHVIGHQENCSYEHDF